MLVYPNTVGRSYVLWLGQSLLQRLTEKGLIEDAQIVEPPSTGCLDFQLAAGKTDEELIREALRWERDTIGTGHVASRHVAGHPRPRSVHAWSEGSAHSPARSAGRPRSLQLSRAAAASPT